ncbi:MAG: cysteine desulfurase family protein [Christensenellales bacterium]
MTAYLDNSATTRPSDVVIEAMRQAMADDWFNPSSLYAPSLMADRKMDLCRQLIQDRLRSKGRVIFTAGGTEADNLAILGGLSRSRTAGRIICSAGEHPAVRESCKAAAGLGYEVQEAPLTGEGLTDVRALEALVSPDTRLICVMQVNNETGAIQPLAEISALRRRLCPDALLHVDGVQGFLRLPCAAEELGIDSYALSGHKIHGPKGIGALWTGKRVHLQPLMFGGGQEGGLRSGTPNTPGVAGLAAAIMSYPEAHSMRQLKLALFERLRAAIPGLSVNGPDPYSSLAADHILNLSFPPVRAETMLHALEARQVYVGNGSACSSRSKQVSHVLQAMGKPANQSQSAIRFSLNPFLTAIEIDQAAQAVIDSYEMLRHYSRH